MSGSFFTSTINRVMSWAQSHSLWYVTTGPGCCADEMLETVGCRYDFERFGCIPQSDPRHSDLLIVTGGVTYKSAPQLQRLFDSMIEPKHVIALGACACKGGSFGPEKSYSVVPGVDQIIPVDVFVPGCPPRPEAIMNGLITLQEKINE